MITVFTTNACAYCAMVKKFLDLKGADYQIVNIEEEPARREEAFSLSGVSSVPVTTNGSEVVVGFVPAKLLGLLS